MMRAFLMFVAFAGALWAADARAPLFALQVDGLDGDGQIARGKPWIIRATLYPENNEAELATLNRLIRHDIKPVLLLSTPSGDLVNSGFELVVSPAASEVETLRPLRWIWTASPETAARMFGTATRIRVRLMDGYPALQTNTVSVRLISEPQTLEPAYLKQKHALLAEYYCLAGRIADAYTAINRLLSIQPADAGALFAASDVFRACGDQENARRSLSLAETFVRETTVAGSPEFWRRASPPVR